MSLKENVDYIKEEISTQESFIENFFKLEKFYKKYKVAIFSIVSIVIIAFAGSSIYSYTTEQNRLEANDIFNSYLANPSDDKLLESLKQKDTKLYSLAMYIKNSSSLTQVEFFKEISQYSTAMKTEDLNALNSSIQNQKFLLKDFATFNKALIEVNQGNYSAAKETLKLIPITSNVSNLVKMLEHHMLTK
ncbi:MAG: hypothetical protein U9O56_07635 [Campylobacterota bacterium]|nr:hypothetical protein [Campylobacterota bacterium]